MGRIIESKNGEEYLPIENSLPGANEFSHIVNREKKSNEFYYLDEGSIIVPKLDNKEKYTYPKTINTIEKVIKTLDTVLYNVIDAVSKSYGYKELFQNWYILTKEKVLNYPSSMGYVLKGNKYFTIKSMQPLANKIALGETITFIGGDVCEENFKKKINKNILHYVGQQGVLGLSIVALGAYVDAQSPLTGLGTETAVSMGIATTTNLKDALIALYVYFKKKDTNLVLEEDLITLEKSLKEKNYDKAFILGDNLDGTENKAFIRENLLLGSILHSLKDKDNNTFRSRFENSGYDTIISQWLFNLFDAYNKSRNDLIEILNAPQQEIQRV